MEGSVGLVKGGHERSWRGFKPADWCDNIDVRDFIVRNVTPYAGDEQFLVGPSARTKSVWAKLQPYFQDERTKGVLAVDATTPSTMLAHKAGYIDRDNEIIVGLQTDQPFKRAIFPWGGLRMVEAGLKAAGFQADPQVHEAFSKYRKTHNDGVFDAYNAAGFEHCVANIYFIPIGLLIKAGAPDAFWNSIGKVPADFPALTAANFFANLIPVTIGNIIGGSILVGAVYWFVYLRKRSA